MSTTLACNTPQKPSPRKLIDFSKNRSRHRNLNNSRSEHVDQQQDRRNQRLTRLPQSVFHCYHPISHTDVTEEQFLFHVRSDRLRQRQIYNNASEETRTTQSAVKTGADDFSVIINKKTGQREVYKEECKVRRRASIGSGSGYSAGLIHSRSSSDSLKSPNSKKASLTADACSQLSLHDAFDPTFAVHQQHIQSPRQSSSHNALYSPMSSPCRSPKHFVSPTIQQISPMNTISPLVDSSTQPPRMVRRMSISCSSPMTPGSTLPPNIRLLEGSKLPKLTATTPEKTKKSEKQKEQDRRDAYRGLCQIQKDLCRQTQRQQQRRSSYESTSTSSTSQSSCESTSEETGNDLTTSSSASLVQCADAKEIAHLDRLLAASPPR
jgi:hypothetical protein